LGDEAAGEGPQPLSNALKFQAAVVVVIVVAAGVVAT
jgi:hypothetical protein